MKNNYLKLFIFSLFGILFLAGPVSASYLVPKGQACAASANDKKCEVANCVNAGHLNLYQSNDVCWCKFFQGGGWTGASISCTLSDHNPNPNSWNPCVNSVQGAVIFSSYYSIAGVQCVKNQMTTYCSYGSNSESDFCQPGALPSDLVGVVSYSFAQGCSALVDCCCTPAEVASSDQQQTTVVAKVTMVNPLKGISVQGLIGKVINAVLGVVGTLALAMFAYGGLLWMTAAGNEKQVSSGQKILLWSALGLILIFSSYAIVRFLLASIL